MIVKTLQNEYWFHVSDQSEIPIAGNVDKSIDIDKLILLFDNFKKSPNKREFIILSLRNDIDLIDILRTLVGVSDKRMYLELSYIFAKTPNEKTISQNILGGTLFDLNKHPLSFFKNLSKSKNKKLAEKSVSLICDYLIKKGLIEILETMSKLNFRELDSLIEKLILTKEVQQAEAKRRGHGAEFELAKLIHNLGCKTIPEDRHSRAIGHRDPNVDRKNFTIRKKEKGETWSFDLIINKDKTPMIFIQSLIHTSDPGQYGVNKSDETVQIKHDIINSNRLYGSKKELWGLVDGVGFCENKKDTIDKMLYEFDSFIQLKSLYKAGLKLHKLGLTKIKSIIFNDSFYTEEIARQMFQNYGTKDIKFYYGESIKTEKNDKIIPAGMATIIL